MRGTKKKRGKKGGILLAAVLIAELLLGLFMPRGVFMNLGDALMAPIGLPHIIGYQIEVIGGALYPFDPFNPAMGAVNNEWHLRRHFNGGDTDVWYGGTAYDAYVRDVQANCWVFLLLWVFLAVELVCIFRQRRKEKKEGRSGTVLGLVAALLTPLLWAECIYLITGTLHPLGSFFIAFVVFMSLFYGEQNRARREAARALESGQFGQSGQKEQSGQDVVLTVHAEPQTQMPPCAVPEPPLIPRYCRKCGAKLIADSRYCSQCGTEVKTLDTEEEQP